MIFSAQQLFSDDQAVTATAISDNVIDTGVRGTPYDAAASLNGDIGKGNFIPILVQATAAATAAGAATVTFTIETGSTTALGTVVATVGPVAKADLVAGYQIPIQVLPTEVTERYLGVRYTVATGPLTAGNFTAGITMGNQTNVTGG